LPSESTPLLDNEAEQEHHDIGHALRPEPSSDDTREGARAVTLAIYVNLIANTILLIVKVVVTALTSSLSVLASLVDAALDWLSTAIVWTTNWLVSRQNQYEYPIGRRRLEPLGVLVFSVIMVTSFVQVALEGFSRLNSGDRRIVQLTVPAVVMMASTVVIKLLCWVWCRSVKNSSVQALAQDAKTDIVFNTFSIIFPLSKLETPLNPIPFTNDYLVGYFAKIWWFDPVGGIALSLFVIVSWSRTSVQHIRNLTGATASADERNVLLYLTMRFAKSIKQIQGLQAYHSGDKLVVEVDIVLDESMSLRDSHDLGESLQYVLESVPTVDRAFVHQDYASYNLPSHMQQDD
jgi:divalent metal cation (Fe/Co/Zn/Cd) transporter